jgi:hypothetical protein
MWQRIRITAAGITGRDLVHGCHAGLRKPFVAAFGGWAIAPKYGPLGKPDTPRFDEKQGVYENDMPKRSFTLECELPLRKTTAIRCERRQLAAGAEKWMR